MRTLALCLVALLACSSDDAPSNGGGATSGSPAPGNGNGNGNGNGTGNGTSGGPTTPAPVYVPTDPATGPAAGNPDGKCEVPVAAALEDVSAPKTVVGTGTPESCTSEAFVGAVAKGGVITFNCGANPATITLKETAKIFNNTGPKIVIDGGGKVTLSGGGKVRILYMSTCDKNQVWLSGNCNDQLDPQLTVQNLTFIDANATGLEVQGKPNSGGGSAIYAQGGTLKVINSRFFSGVCDSMHSDLGGAAIRRMTYTEVAGGSAANRVTHIIHSTFGSTDKGNKCANGGGLSGLHASYNIVNSYFAGNQAVGKGANDGQGGNGGAIYMDGVNIGLSTCGTLVEDNHANEGGSSVFFVDNDDKGKVSFTDTIFRRNPKDKAGFETQNFPGMYIKGNSSPVTVQGSTIEK